MLHAALGLSAVGAGLALTFSPSGDPLSFDVEWLDGAPFDDYRVPGLFLAAVIGPTNLASAAGFWAHHGWAPLASLGTGLLLLVWMTIQTLIVGLRDWTQPAWMVIFLLVTALATREVLAVAPSQAPRPSQTSTPAARSTE